MKVLKWVIGVPVGLFVLAFVLFAINDSISGGDKPSYFQSQIDDCRRQARSLYASGDKAKSRAVNAECDTLDRMPVKR